MNLWGEIFKQATRQNLTKILCDRFNGIGADGLLFLQPGKETDFHWDFYNRDGSSAEMCGNAARCAFLWAETIYQHNLPSKSEYSFSTLAGTVRVSRRSPSQIAVQMPMLTDHQSQLQVSLNLETATVEWINSGVPHAVIERSSLEPRPELLMWAQKLRHHSHFGPHGTNVTFFTRLDSNRISTLTFERGVEEFTRSCGTGAVAAAWAAGQKNIDVRVSGGDLRIEFAKDISKGIFPTLIGPAIYIGSFAPSQELLGRATI